MGRPQVLLRCLGLRRGALSSIRIDNCGPKPLLDLCLYTRNRLFCSEFFVAHRKLLRSRALCPCATNHRRLFSTALHNGHSMLTYIFKILEFHKRPYDMAVLNILVYDMVS